MSPTKSERFTWPEITIIGVESSHAPATPVIALVPPGPGCDQAAAPMDQKTLVNASEAMAAACSWSMQNGVEFAGMQFSCRVIEIALIIRRRRP